MTNTFTVKSANTDFDKIHLVNMEGRVVRTFAKTSNLSYDVSQIAEGLYLVLFEDNKQNRISGKIQIKH
ncbi:MAG: T9SS type A sorting domain-containing protein [Cytophagales bacterium]|nr:T9SS type A sorting domain-containing protein [Cytophagales bacterium]